MTRRRNEIIGRLRARQIRLRGTGATQGGLTLNGGLRGSATSDVASIATGAQANVTITVTGAALGDCALFGGCTVDTSSLNISATVSAANTVKLTLTNNSGGAVDLASATFTAIVLKHSGIV